LTPECFERRGREGHAEGAEGEERRFFNAKIAKGAKVEMWWGEES
jgi:hypothetical protein